MERIVIKIGSSSITNHNGLEREQVLNIAGQIAVEMQSGREIVIVSSGAIATGKKSITDFSDRVVDKQASAIFGQPAMAWGWIEAFNYFGIQAGASLYKDDDLVNIKQPLLRALKEGIVIVNGNDAVYDEKSEAQIISRDNDILASFIARAINASKLIMLTGSDGVLDNQGELIRTIDTIDDLGRIGIFGKTKEGTGGMLSKVSGARDFITAANKVAYIANARMENVIVRILNGESVGTRVTLPSQSFFIFG